VIKLNSYYINLIQTLQKLGFQLQHTGQRKNKNNKEYLFKVKQGRFLRQYYKLLPAPEKKIKYVVKGGIFRKKF
jgi:hypothetical protein